MKEAKILLNKLRKALRVKGKVAIAFSGGLDSSVIAKVASESACPVLYTVGLRGCKDFDAAVKAADILGLPLKLIEIKEKDVLEAVPLLAQVIANDSKLIISYELPLWFVCKNCKENVVVSGQGADELFGGYAKYQKLKAEELLAKLKIDSEAVKNEGVVLERAIARHFGKGLLTPYLDNDIFSFALTLPLEEKINGGERKIILREVARLLGLGEISQRKKRAAQYGSGIAKILRRA